MKTRIFLTLALFLNLAAHASLDGFFVRVSSGLPIYTVPSGKIVVLQQVCFATTETLANHAVTIGSFSVPFMSATNGLYTLTKAMLLPSGTTIATANSTPILLSGVLIDTADAPLFVGGGSSFGNFAVVGNTVTGELHLSANAASKVLIQSSSDLVNWAYDTTAVIKPGSDKTKVRFTVAATGADRYYRAIVRRSSSS